MINKISDPHGSESLLSDPSGFLTAVILETKTGMVTNSSWKPRDLIHLVANESTGSRIVTRGLKLWNFFPKQPSGCRF